MTRKIWLVTGVHSDCWIENIKQNYKRCRTQNSELIIVENGKGIGLWKNAGLGEHIITSDPGAANYINAGIEYAKGKAGPDDWFFKFDSDDFYGKDRVNQINHLADNGAEACGAISIFVKTESNELIALDSKIEAGELIPKTHAPHGPTIGARLDKTIPFVQPPEPWGEDANWIHAMRETGIDFYALPIDGFAYVRHKTGTHTFPVPEGLVRHLWFMAAFNLGEWDIEVVEGIKKPKTMVPVPYSAKDTVKACEYLLDKLKESMKDKLKESMNIHPIKKNYLDKLNDLVGTKNNIELQVGALQIQIQNAQRKIEKLSIEHERITGELQESANIIADEFNALATAGRIILERGVFVEGVPPSLDDKIVIEAIDDYMNRTKSKKSSLNKIGSK